MFGSISSFIRFAWEALGQFPGDYNDVAPLEQSSHVNMAGIPVPKDVLQMIFRNLSLNELGKICTVCRVFNAVASGDSLWNSYDLRKEVFPNVTYITQEDWKTYYGLASVQRGRPCVNKTDYIELKRMEEQVEGGLGITIIEFVPNDKISDVENSAANPKAGNPVTFQSFSSYIRKELGDIPSKAVVVAMTNNIFIDSRKKSVEKRKTILEDMKCKPFGILAATRLATMRCCMSPQGAEVRLFSDNPPTWTLCFDEKKDETTGKTVEVISHFGYFAPAGPHVDGYGYDRGGIGVGGLREFKVLDPENLALASALGH